MVPFARYLLKISVQVGAAGVAPLLEEVPLLAPLELDAPLLELELLAPLEPEALPPLDDTPAS